MGWGCMFRTSQNLFSIIIKNYLTYNCEINVDEQISELFKDNSNSMLSIQNIIKSAKTTIQYKTGNWISPFFACLSLENIINENKLFDGLTIININMYDKIEKEKYVNIKGMYCVLISCMLGLQ